MRVVCYGGLKLGLVAVVEEGWTRAAARVKCETVGDGSDQYGAVNGAVNDMQMYIPR